MEIMLTCMQVDIRTKYRSNKINYFSKLIQSGLALRIK